MKAFMTDLDHTFLRSDLTLSAYSINVWNAKASHTPMGIATARSLTKSKELLKALHLSAPLILLDGAVTLSPDRKLIDIKTLDKQTGDAIIALGTKHGIDPFIIGLKDDRLNESFLYPRRLNDYQRDVLKGYKNDPRLLFNPDNRAMKHNLKIVYFGSKEQLAPLYDAVKNDFAHSVEAKLSPEKYGGGWFLTLLHPEGDKAHALRKAAEYMRIPTDAITVFGDSVNDLGMFALAGKSVAVANALDEVKAAADVVLEHTNDEDGVARYLDSCDANASQS